MKWLLDYIDIYKTFDLLMKAVTPYIVCPHDHVYDNRVA